MKTFLKNNSQFFLIIFCLVIGAFLRFYNLTWGSPYFFHPDENNIAAAVSRIAFPMQMNPHFFAYGSFPMYVIYFFSLVMNHFSLRSISFSQAIYMSRFLSALFSLLLIPLSFAVTKELTNNRKVFFFVALLTTFSTGFIQFAHFGTFEMWLSFFSLLLLYTLLLLIKKPTYHLFLLTAVLSGILSGIKISSIIFVGIPLGIYIVIRLKKQKTIHSMLLLLLHCAMYLFVIAGIFLLTNPYALLDSQPFLSSIHYESAVAFGSLPVFYTQSFIGTIPILYQISHVFPFLLGPIIGFLAAPCFLLFIVLSYKQKNSAYIALSIFAAIFFLSQSLLFVKWARYMVPLDIFFIIIFSIMYSSFLFDVKTRVGKACIFFGGVGILLLSVVSSISYVATVFMMPDTRIAAAAWADTHIQSSASFLTEPYDLGVVAFPFARTTQVDMYTIDQNSTIQNDFYTKLATVEYILLPSQRLMRSRLLQPKLFPFGSRYYTKLLDGSLGFSLIYETPCNISCTIAYGSDSIFSLEETTSVFDHPTIFIFKKTKQFTPLEYQAMFTK